ncbi:MAG: hypothetical protein ACI8RZ_004241 [Myxococcota bacterium]|jgi:hypothetical protein
MNLLIALVTTAAADTGTVRAAYANLMRAGCNLDEVQVWTPLEARVLRNTPYAVAGYQFSSPELTALYASDGVWYQPVTKDVTLSAADTACVAKLKAHESELRRDFAFAVPPADFEKRLATDAGVFVALHSWSQLTDLRNPYGNVTAVRGAGGEWHISWPWNGCVDDPEQGLECGGYYIECPVEGTCTTTTAG